MTDLDSADAVEAFIAANGVDALQRMLDGGQLSGKRKMYAEGGVERFKARELARAQQLRDGLEERATVAAEQQAGESKRSADAAEWSATEAKRSADHARNAWIVALVAAIISACSLSLELWSKLRPQ